jgi:hypothetical protein
MEKPDVEQWTVYDIEGYRRALSSRSDGAVAIGERVGPPDVDDVLKRLRTYLEWARPERRWAMASFDDLLEAAEEANRTTEALDARRSRKIIFALSIAVGTAFVWWLARRLTGR